MRSLRDLAGMSLRSDPGKLESMVMLIAALFMTPKAISPNSIPRGYVCHFTSEPIKLDGRLDDPAWQNAPWTDDFVDIQGSKGPTPRFRTRAKMLWDQKYLYVGAELQEPEVWATLTENESVIFHDNDFEIFIDPNNTGAPYMEFEVNALNTTWDLLLLHPYRGGGPPVSGWDIKGLKSAVHVDGKINSPGHPSKGWSVEVAIPWTGISNPISELCQVPCPPEDGDQWRINFSRVEWHADVKNGQYVKTPNLPEDNWVWSPMGVIDMHRPEHWGVIQFTKEPSGPVALKPLDGWEEKLDIVKVWEAEETFRKKHGHWSESQEELGVSLPSVKIYATPNLLEIVCGNWHADQSLRFWKSAP